MSESDRQPLKPKAGEVIVRMYRPGLGDCFLLAFGRSRRPPLFVLIDCGIHMRQPDGRQRLAQVMQDIVATTDSKIDIVVATHAHADHLVGFVQKDSPFLANELQIASTWVAWTERYGDPQADRLRRKHGHARRVIEKAVEKARQQANDRAMAHLADMIDTLRGFELAPEGSTDPAHEAEVRKLVGRLVAGNPDRDAIPGALGLGAAGLVARGDAPSSNELAYGLLMAKAPTVFWEPGAVRDLDGVANVRVYALGPPRNEKLLKKDKPTRVRGGHDHDYQETYLSALRGNVAFQAAPALVPDSELSDEHRHPFAAEHRQRLTPQVPAVQRSTVLDDLLTQHYYHPDAAWRRIGGDWLRTAEELALNLDGDTNNTSLVLAFELGEPGQGEVLLFAADAQVGNWLSWRNQSYGRGDAEVHVDDLLRRTRLYKVGHHGSHNATVKADPREEDDDGAQAPFGLELMDDIIAMIPVDRAATDRKMPIPWRMPHEPLYRRLREKAERRVLRSDQLVAPLASNSSPDRVPTSAAWRATPGLTNTHWRHSKLMFELGTAGPLYYDVRFRMR